MTVLFKQELLSEREMQFQVKPDECSETRQAKDDRFKKKTLKTRYGALSVNVPQIRETDFYPGCLEKGLRSERW
ncbi:hypothetical protein HOH45_05045 [bacterium]|nr:hypothetical protein [bacterium]